MKKVLFIVPFLSSGGAERVVSIWSTELARLGANVHIIVFYRNTDEYAIDEKVNLHTISKGKREYDALTKLEKILALRKSIKVINPNLIIPFISYVGLMTTIASIGLPSKIIETIRIDPRYSPQKRFSKLLRNLSVLLSKRCIVQNELQKKYFSKYIQKKVVIFPNPIANEFIEEEKVFLNNEIINIVAVGRLEKQKNYPMLINAFVELAKDNRKVLLKIYGEGSLYNELEEIIKTKEASNIILLCGRTIDIKKALKESDLFILSSDAEGMPNSLMEAMALGLPCISTDCSTGPSDLIEDGVNGRLIPVADEKALIKSMKSMIENAEVSIKMGKRARETILSNYSAKVSTRNLFNFIKSI